MTDIAQALCLPTLLSSLYPMIKWNEQVKKQKRVEQKSNNNNINNIQ